jgi:hypothetical protein
VTSAHGYHHFSTSLCSLLQAHTSRQSIALHQQRSKKSAGIPSAVVPCEGLQGDLVLLDGHCKVVGVQHCEIPKELLHLVDHLSQVHLCQILQPQVFNPVREDCTAWFFQCSSLDLIQESVTVSDKATLPAYITE